MGTEIEALEELDLKVRCGLLGTAEEQEDAIVLLFARYKEPLMKYLRKEFPELPSDELVSAVQDTFIAVDQNKKTLGDTDKPLSRFLFSVAKRRGIDVRRRRARKIQIDDDISDEIAQALDKTFAKIAWDDARSTGRVTALIEEFREFVSTLKGQQRRVASIIADNIPYRLSDREIAEEIYARTNHVISTIEVKGARTAMRHKFRNILHNRDKRCPTR